MATFSDAEHDRTHSNRAQAIFVAAQVAHSFTTMARQRTLLRVPCREGADRARNCFRTVVWLVTTSRV
jgi:hypothetical protein